MNDPQTIANLLRLHFNGAMVHPATGATLYLFTGLQGAIAGATFALYGPLTVESVRAKMLEKEKDFGAGTAT